MHRKVDISLITGFQNEIQVLPLNLWFPMSFDSPQKAQYVKEIKMGQCLKVTSRKEYHMDSSGILSTFVNTLCSMRSYISLYKWSFASVALYCPTHTGEMMLLLWDQVLLTRHRPVSCSCNIPLSFQTHRLHWRCGFFRLLCPRGEC